MGLWRSANAATLNKSRPLLVNTVGTPKAKPVDGNTFSILHHLCLVNRESKKPCSYLRSLHYPCCGERKPPNSADHGNQKDARCKVRDSCPMCVSPTSINNPHMTKGDQQNTLTSRVELQAMYATCITVLRFC